MADRQGIRYHDQASIRLACLCGNNEFEFAAANGGRIDGRGHAAIRSVQVLSLIVLSP
jgi:hypothetical protein